MILKYFDFVTSMITFLRLDNRVVKSQDITYSSANDEIFYLGQITYKLSALGIFPP